MSPSSSVVCSTCGALGDEESGFSKYGWPDDDVPLPPAAGRLDTVAGWRSGGRGEELQRCPECGRWFHWRLSYEYLVNGSEDEETLTRIDAAAAEELRARLTERV